MERVQVNWQQALFSIKTGKLRKPVRNSVLVRTFPFDLFELYACINPLNKSCLFL